MDNLKKTFIIIQCLFNLPIPYYHPDSMSTYIRENKILFIGGLTGTHDPNEDDDIMTTCSILTITHNN